MRGRLSLVCLLVAVSPLPAAARPAPLRLGETVRADLPEGRVRRLDLENPSR